MEGILAEKSRGRREGSKGVPGGGPPMCKGPEVGMCPFGEIPTARASRDGERDYSH